ncbi:IPT/TIG domain-containing protein [Tunicatimonas pelagia]|uniref:IPT/TIG domain-containing protein n=1 Tax=Tunicatimonas pelagia TaxID=931531 RepID=UPI002665603B|nr:IPT/TIG domain-containing protein [Tunicatimonas pelagia]WKN44961.1 IPT/TIG domain-containing protein [Tunicatimonas pelagia]
MPTKIILSSLILCIILLAACQEEEVETSTPSVTDSLPTASPSVVTLDAKVFDEGGVVLSGELITDGSISDYGFIFSADSIFDEYSDNLIFLEDPPKLGRFEASILSSLRGETTYFFRAFIKFGEETIYGETKKFESSGSRCPIISRIAPEQGHLEDTIQLFGKYFGTSTYSSSTHVTFSNQYSRIISIDDSVITCVVPETIVEHQHRVTVTSMGKSAAIPFSLYSPLIELIEPASATFGDTLKLFGQHLDHVAERNTIMLGNAKAEIVTSQRNSLEFIVPDELAENIPSLQLTSQLQTVNAPASFSIILPEIVNAPECSNAYEEITLEGNYFHPVSHQNRVFIEGVKAEVLSGTTQQLIVRVPFGPFPNGSGRIDIGVTDTVVTTEQQICIQDPWLMISNSLPFSFYGDVGTFTINNRVFVVSDPEDYQDQNLYLWEFDEETISWTKETIPFNVQHSGTCVGNGSKGYVYTATSTDNFWEYDPATTTWTQKPDFPGARRDKPTSFSVNGNVYVGLGTDFEPYFEVDYFDFYKFDASLNQWIKVSDFPNDPYTRGRTEASTFVIDQAAYVVGGARTTGSYSAWKYQPSEDQWVSIADFPDARNYTSAFSLDGKGYIANGSPVGGGERKECWEYNPASNTWSPFFDIGHKSRFRGFAFVINGTAYVGGGSGGRYDDLTEYELYKLRK